MNLKKSKGNSAKIIDAMSVLYMEYERTLSLICILLSILYV